MSYVTFYVNALAETSRNTWHLHLLIIKLVGYANLGGWGRGLVLKNIHEVCCVVQTVGSCKMRKSFAFALNCEEN